MQNMPYLELHPSGKGLTLLINSKYVRMYVVFMLKAWEYLTVLLVTGLYAIKYLWRRKLFFVGVGNNCAYTLKFLP